MKAMATVSLVIVFLTTVNLTTSVAAAKNTVPYSIRMSQLTPGNVPLVPPVKGYSEGQEIWFLHTETSDSTVAEILTKMMDSPVLAVPSLADTPNSMRARVYVFRNGIKGGGSIGFQPDVSDHPPGDPAYSPLRSVNVVTWKDKHSVRLLKSAIEVDAALAKRDLNVDDLGVVVNMPMVTWPDGQR